MEYPIQRLIRVADKPKIQPKQKIQVAGPTSFGPLDDTANADRDKGFNHESFGRDILEQRSDIADAIGDYNQDNEIGKIITKDHIDNYRYSQFITGTLDADRLDFLLRDSLAAGVSYGNIDLRYLLDNFEYDENSNQFYIAYGGIHALEHFITSRFYLYNITYHKTVMGFELFAKYAYYKMVKDGTVNLVSSKKEIYDLMEDTDRFLQFNDEYFWSKLRAWPASEPIDVAVRNALLLRYPARELYSERVLLEVNQSGRGSSFKVLNARLYNDRAFDQILSQHGIERSSLAMLDNVIDFEETAPLKDRAEQPDVKKEWALCKVFYDGKIQPLIDVPGSIISNLSCLSLHIKRLYYLQLDSKQTLERAEIRRDIEQLAANV